MICFPNAKINLGLHVTGLLDDGYHSIETLFYPAPLVDALEAVPSASASFTQTGLRIENSPLDDASPSGQNDNLVLKACTLLSQTHTLPPLDVYLRKAIPAGAGLGGGSADAAFMLRLLNRMCQLNIPDAQLETTAAALGADCPFFIRNTPTLAAGRGNEFTPVSLSLKGYIIYIVKPPVAVSTREAYAAVRPKQPSFPLGELPAIPVQQWKDVLVNDFEPVIFPCYPEISEIKDKLYRHGAVYASMSGSGSAVFGLFTTDTLSRGALHASFRDCFTWKGTLA